MHKWTGKIVLLALLTFSLQAQSADWHCITSTSQTSVDYEGKTFRSICTPYENLNANKQAEEKKNCERGSRKNKAKTWLEGACPTKDRIGTCTITKMGPATLPQPKIVHTYEEHGGNLSLEDEVNLACQQCAQMSLNSGHFKVDKVNKKTANIDPSCDLAQSSAEDETQDESAQDSSATNKGVDGVKEALDSLKGSIFK